MLHLIAKVPLPWRHAIQAALLGDAFGVPHEFKLGAQVPRADQLDMVMPVDYPKTYGWIPYGTWSDDGSQLLALVDELSAPEGFSARRFGLRLLAWYENARYQAGGLVFDCGGQTRAALAAIRAGHEVSANPANCGNGSLMRVLPVAALPDWAGTTQAQALRVAMAQSSVTHPQPMARVCCALYVMLAWRAAEGAYPLRREVPGLVVALPGLVELTADEQACLTRLSTYGSRNLPNNGGHAPNSLWSALWAVDRSKNFSEALRNVVSVGADTDTVACLAAGLASLIFGWDDEALAWHRSLNYSTAPGSGNFNQPYSPPCLVLSTTR